MIYRSAAIALSVLMCSLVAFGCAKRPVIAGVSAPAPTAEATTVAPVAPAPSAPAPSAAAPAPAAPEPAPQPSASAQTQPSPSAAPSAAVVERPQPAEFTAIPQVREVYFDFDKYDIRPDAAKTLDANAEWLKTNATQLVLIEGHCDERGTNQYNLALGERRARATMNYLMTRGVARERMTITSYGEERPVCTEHNEACWSKNRRARTLVKPS